VRGVVVEQLTAEFDHGGHALVGEPVLHGAVLTACVDEAGGIEVRSRVRARAVDASAPIAKSTTAGWSR
jgi:hypothetical protein